MSYMPWPAPSNLCFHSFAPSDLDGFSKALFQQTGIFFSLGTIVSCINFKIVGCQKVTPSVRYFRVPLVACGYKMAGER